MRDRLPKIFHVYIMASKPRGVLYVGMTSDLASRAWKHREHVLEGFTRRLRTVPDSLRKTLTYDQGTEMALHQTLAKRLRIDVFFCDPRSPWQRGTNENSNGLVREFLPKGVDLSQFTQQELCAIEYALNHRPRKILGFRTPHEVFSQLKLDHIAGVALQA